MLSDDDMKWLETPATDWSPVRLPHMVLEDSFVSGDSSRRRLSIHYFRTGPDRSLRAKVLFGPGTQGPPGHAHGGSMAAVLDEAMGGAAWMQGHPVVAAELTTRFKVMLPLGTRCIVEARVGHVDGRKVRVVGKLRQSDGDIIYAEGEALFIALDPKKFGPMALEVSRIFSDLAFQEVDGEIEFKLAGMIPLGLLGLGAGAFVPAALALMADTSTEGCYGATMGLYSFALGFGAFIAESLGLGVILAGGEDAPGWLLYLAAALIVLAVIMMFWFFVFNLLSRRFGRRKAECS